MYQKSLRTSALLLTFFTLLSASYTQSAIRFKAVRASVEEDQLYLQHFKAYTVATLSTAQVSELLRSKNYFSTLSLEYNDHSYSFNLQAHDYRAPHYKLRASTDAGVVEMPRTPNKTYLGYTLDGHFNVRITSDEDSFYGLIEQEHDALYIEPAKHIAPMADENQFVIYWASDNLKKFPLTMCGSTAANLLQGLSEDYTPEHHDYDGGSRACKVVQIALADDHFMFNEYGSVSACEDHNMAVINNVLTNYDFEFNDDLQFSVVEIFVATSDPNDPWSNSTDIEIVLDDFTAWGPNGFDNTHDIASLWSGRNFDGNVIGLAWVSSVCSNFKYNVLEDFSSNANLLRVLQAHEMGHNFSAQHDAPNSNTIMAPAVQNTNLWSPESITSINNKIASVNCLSSCAPPAPPVAAFTADPTEGCDPLTVFFDDQSTNNPTAWSWTFPGGVPGTSTQQNPVVTYNTPGNYNVSLMVTNAQGSNSLTIPNFISVGQEPVADFDYTVDELTVDFDNTSSFADTYFWDFDDGFTSTQANPIHTYAADGVYTVTLTASNDCGSDIFVTTITIITTPLADFSSNITEGCNPFEVDFYNFSSDNATSFLWSFPGGSPPSSTAFEPSVVYEIPGTYNVTLTAFNSAGEDSFTEFGYITVNPEPEADFTYVANGLQVMFNSSTSIGDDFFWNFGDGHVSTQENPTHVYTSGGTYTVLLTVSNICGSNSIQLIVNVTGAPVADFVANVEYGCAPLVVHYTSTSLGNPTSYNWEFQGGTPFTSTQANPTVTYNTPGLFDVELTVSNAAGNNTLILNDFIEVEFPTTSNFTYAVNGLLAIFTNQSTHSTGSIWYFGDGGQSTSNNPSHSYNQDGVYTVTLISTGVCGNDTSTAQVTIQTPPQAGFSIQQSDFCLPSTVSFTNESSPNATSFAWSFPGGSPATSSATNPVITYNTAGTFDVSLIAFSPTGSDTMVWPQVVTIGDAPDAAFLLATNGMSITLTNQSTDADTYLWFFGDGQTSTEENPTHNYGSFGIYEIWLIATNECGNDTMEVVIELSTVPNAFFSFNAHNGCAPFEVQFIDQSQNNPTSWSWTFEGGNPPISSLQNPIVLYQVPGDYLVSLSVQNGQGSDVLVLDDLIQVSGTPDATFNHTQIENTLFLEYAGLDYDSLHWSFGDGRTDNSLNPTVAYAVDGQYEISLIVFNGCGTDTASILVTIETTSTFGPDRLEGNWTLRPNPFTDLLMVAGESTHEGDMTIIVRDIHGKMISTQAWNHASGNVVKEITVNSIPPGLYLVELRDKSASTVLRAVRL